MYSLIDRINRPMGGFIDRLVHRLTCDPLIEVQADQSMGKLMSRLMNG